MRPLALCYIGGSFGNVLPRAPLLRLTSEALVFRPLPALLVECLDDVTFLRRVKHLGIVLLFTFGS
jgi:hypothetical protein